MKHQASDKEIDALYQQRKQQISAPEINLSYLKEGKKSPYTLIQMLSILFCGGAASFGILAVISHFSTMSPPQVIQTEKTKLNVVEIDFEKIEPEEPVIAIQIPPLIPKKPYVALVQPKNNNILTVKPVANEVTLIMPIDVVTVSVAPSVKAPELSLVPIYQEQPKYSVKAIRAKQEGTIKLAYEISAPKNASKAIDVYSRVVGKKFTVIEVRDMFTPPESKNFSGKGKSDVDIRNGVKKKIAKLISGFDNKEKPR